MNHFIKNNYFLLLLLSTLIFINCKKWDHNITLNGVFFERVTFTKEGAILGKISDDQSIQEYPCAKGWVHFNSNEEIVSFQLCKDYVLNTVYLPKGTWVHFSKDRQGEFICAFPSDYEIQGYICKGSGGFKGIQTSFYKNGRLKSFYPKENITINEIPCLSTLLVNIELYEDGTLKECMLAKDYKHNDKKYKKGTIFHFR